MPPFDLVIFDCDGVLIDSEGLHVRTEARVLETLGWPLTEAEIIERFVGRSAAYMQAEVEARIGRPIDWATEFDEVFQRVAETELVVVPGVLAVLEAITVPTCVASSSSHEMLAFSLGLVGLNERFTGRVFSADDVEHGKPSPDLFLHAAHTLKAAPERCAVIEDSPSGVTAGLAAGMTVFAFAGGITSRPGPARDGVVVFDDMTELPMLLGL